MTEATDRYRDKIEVDGFGVFAVIFLFWMFWFQSGWYRIDCALGVQKACELVAAEYEAKKHH